ncbi:glycosyltransferase family 2 protein [Arthrobacter sp. NPDC056727]|uniref:glycosyltransferase family 2 protein n=1 Tax=Arthrobacter sp. NPDC056727 TaxID=3345927 RepID=UPI003672E9C7
MPRYTVVMPAKNCAPTVEVALRSVLRGLPSDAEVVVWDDGSTDETSEIVQSVSDSRIKLMQSDESIGGGLARQKVLATTDSEFVVNMDADDVSLPWRFRLQLAEMDNSDFCFAATLRFGAGKFARPTLPLGYSDVETRASLAFHNGLSHPTMVARRATLDRVGGYSSSPVAQDYELWLRAASQKARFRRIGAPCLAYRISPNQVSNQANYIQRILARPEIFQSYLALVESLLPGNPQSIREARGIAEQLDTVKANLPRLISLFGSRLRPYYRQILRNEPTGPFALLRAHGGS